MWGCTDCPQLVLSRAATDLDIMSCSRVDDRFVRDVDTVSALRNVLAAAVTSVRAAAAMPNLCGRCS